MTIDELDKTIDKLERDDLFNKYITKVKTRFQQNRAFTAISNIATLFEYSTLKQGVLEVRLRLAYEKA